MPSVIIWALALVVMVLESVLLDLFSAPGWALQTPIAVTIYLGLDRNFSSGGLILVALLLPVEWLVAGVYGVYSLALAVLFLVLRLLRPNMQPVWGVARAVVAAVMVPLHAVVMLGVLFMSGAASHGEVTSVIGVQVWTSIPLVVAITLVMGRGFARLEKMMDSRKAGGELEF